MQCGNREIEIRRLKCYIIKEALQGSGFIISDENPNASIIWWDGLIHNDEFSGVKNNQRINKIPGMDVICYKSTLFQGLNQMQILFPQYYNFFPTSFLLPHQYLDFQKEHMRLYAKYGSNLTWIFKPQSGCCGNGIKLIQNPFLLLNDTSPAIIQRYVNPFLLDGYKFDFRFYILISSLNPLSVYIFKEGIARFCTRKYKTPSKLNLDDKFGHITNTAINIENKEASINYTRTFTDVYEELKGVDERAFHLWTKVKSVALLTILSVYPQAVASITSLQKLTEKSPRIDQLSKYFHILGIDILLDDSLNPVLLELNDRPSMKVSFPCEEGIKRSLISDAIKIVALNEDTNSGWEKLLPSSEGSPLSSIVRSVQQRSLNVFGPKQSMLNFQSTKQIVYPKPHVDKNRLLMRSLRYSYQ